MTKAAAQKYADQWQHRLRLCNWYITWKWYNNETVPKIDDGKEFGDEEAAGRCEAEPKYRYACIHIALKQPNIDVEETIRHELCHALLSELKLWMEYMVDKVTDGTINAAGADTAFAAWWFAEESVARRLSLAVVGE